MKGNEMLDVGLNHQPRRPGNLEFSHWRILILLGYKDVVPDFNK